MRFMSMLRHLTKPIWIYFLLVEGLFSNMAQAQQLEIKRTNADTEIVHYEIALDEFDVANIVAFEPSFRHSLYEAFSDIIDRDGRLGVLEGRTAKLNILVTVRNAEEHIAVDELLIGLGRTWADREAEDRAVFSTRLTRDYHVPEVVVEALTEEQKRILDVAEDLWRTIADFALSVDGENLKGDALVNFAVRAAVNDPDTSSDMQGTIIAVGVWLGDE